MAHMASFGICGKNHSISQRDYNHDSHLGPAHPFGPIQALHVHIYIYYKYYRTVNGWGQHPNSYDVPKRQGKLLSVSRATYRLLARNLTEVAILGL